MRFQNSYQIFHDQLKLYSIYDTLSRPIIVSDNIRSPENMGAILRLAGNIGVLQTLFISDKASTFKKHKVNRTASGGSEKTNWEIIKANELMTSMPADYTLVAIETTTNAQNIYQFKFPAKTSFLIGNEIAGIRDEVIKFAGHKVYIPIPGPISSLNVTHALAIALFEWLRQQMM
ncbi:MAG: TrmH family RNA methyltransferase [Bacteroidetes bacterium]|nr:TrmH family RNA methyltransferase [Bacteroidota bacterium]MBL6944207.1 TrmH family RNA methyltransferase [Bacteroidales bacterium]